MIRLLLVSALVAACSVAATAWIAVQTTSGAIKKQQGQNHADDNLLLDTLTGYAATHPNWDKVGPLVRDLARSSGRRIVLTTQNGIPLAGDTAGSASLPDRAWAVVDPLSANRSDPIDPRATGPFRLTADERHTLDGYAVEQIRCLRANGVEASMTHGPSGRPSIRTFTGTGDRRAAACAGSRLEQPMPTERTPLRQLSALVAGCLKKTGLSNVEVLPDFSWRLTASEAAPLRQGAERQIPPCITSARKTLLKSSVAPPARLLMASQDTDARAFDLSAANTAKVAGATGLVLALAIGVSVMAAMRLIRPLRALTDAAVAGSNTSAGPWSATSRTNCAPR